MELTTTKDKTMPTTYTLEALNKILSNADCFITGKAPQIERIFKKSTDTEVFVMFAMWNGTRFKGALFIEEKTIAVCYGNITVHVEAINN